MDITKILDDLEDLVEDSSSVPFSKKIMVESEPLYELIEDMRNNLPEEIKQAKWIIEEKERIIGEAQSEADSIISEAQVKQDQIIEEARTRFNQMVDEHEVVVAARSKAQSLQAEAEQSARTMKMQSVTYVDDILSQAQERIRAAIGVLEENREELRKY